MNNGRYEIYSDLIPTGDLESDSKIIVKILENAISKHSKNITDIEQLRDYYYNKTDIENKTKTQQSKINTKLAIPYANIAVTTINSYCFSTPFTRNSRSSEDSVSVKIKALNDALDDDDYDAKTAETELSSGICGVGYRFIRPANQEELNNGLWFKTVANLDPTKTFIVKSNNIDKEKIMACNYYKASVYDDKGNKTGEKTVYNVYTKNFFWVIEKGDNDAEYTIISQNVNGKLLKAYPLIYKRIPIIEYVRKQDRTGDFEIGKGLIDSINDLSSSRVDDVRQSVDYILLLRDISCDEEDLDAITKAVSKGILAFKSVPEALVQPEVKVLDTKINQSEVQTLQDFLCHKLEESLNIPNRETRGSSGDTGLAVESRAGYRSLENIAGLITLCAKKADTESLDVILSICNLFEKCPFAGLSIKDIEIKANRNKVENITTASNAYNTLISAGMNDETALNVTQIVPDPIGVAQKNKVAKEEAEQKALENAQKVGKSTEQKQKENPTETK